MLDANPTRRREHAEKPFWVSPRGARIIVLVLHAVAILAILIELVLPLSEDPHGVERADGLEFPASYALYGFVACVLLVALGKLLRRLVMRHENYWRSEA